MTHEFDYAPESVKDEWLDLVQEISDRSGKINPKEWEHFTPQFLDKQTQKHNPYSALEAAETRRQLYEESRITQIEGTVRVRTDLPITVFMIGDVHFGSIFCNNELWNLHRMKIAETPGVYVVFLHNLVDNAIPTKFAPNMLNNSIPPETQFETMQTWIKELDAQGKVLGAIEGDCHDGWSWAAAGISAAQLLYGYQGRRFPVLENGGILHLQLGRKKPWQEYAVGLWHKQGPFHSRFNPEHALRQNRRMYHESQTDVEVGAHHHVTAASASYEGSKKHIMPVQWVRVGTYKGVPTFLGEDHVIDKWASDRFGTSGEPPGASVTFWHSRHTSDSSLDFVTGIEKHMAIRTYALVCEMGLQERFNQLMQNG